MAQHISHGADVEQLDDIAVGLRRQSEKIADVGGRGASLLEKLRALWDGPDFEKFALDWRSAHRVIDDAESSMRTFSRQLVEESEQQRQSSGVSASGADSSGGTGIRVGGRGGEPGESAAVAESTVGSAAESSPESGPVGQLHRDGSGEGEGSPRAEAGFPWQGHGVGRAELVGAAPTITLTPGGGEGLALQVPGWLPIAVPLEAAPFVADDLMMVLPDLPGTEVAGQLEPARPAFERLDPGTPSVEAAAFEATAFEAAVFEATPVEAAVFEATPVEAAAFEAPSAEVPVSDAAGQPPSSAPTQIPTSEGAHVSTASDSAGQRSVAFDPLIEALSGNYSQDGSQMAGWLGIDDLDLLPWS